MIYSGSGPYLSGNSGSGSDPKTRPRKKDKFHVFLEELLAELLNPFKAFLGKHDRNQEQI
jgi:hypothetical protein